MSAYLQEEGGRGVLFLPVSGQRVSLDGPTPNPAAEPRYSHPILVLSSSSSFSSRLSSLVWGEGWQEIKCKAEWSHLSLGKHWFLSQEAVLGMWRILSPCARGKQHCDP